MANKSNDKEKNQFNKMDKTGIAKVKKTLFQGDYGFIDIKDLPKDTHISRTILLEDNDWATTGEFTKNTDNHCAAVASTNIALYYAYQGYIDLLINTSKSAT